ncbi:MULTISPECIES: RNA methyltransferase [unclassified Pseudovibrio]|uniref:RNA methyltransferase n=1 Tax=unclassified Pseudovibrio TaxID=2627060 RepID=UPI0007AE69C8|nr:MULTISPECIES: RNA methyltransferase [unclassified Pseudovibrio]KZK93155.1 tRNA (cytidine/uridine-2'-O-)-methyltransferase TrmJ [Pseudovibrio sp. W74]KZL07046.1 tRNA (cytidine/uridine-2'-O-)-methyltransferase TrmJ [Pseudovibrio sp. Ad14]
MSESTPETNNAIPPVVVLCEPQLGENIGMVARAMANFGLHDLRLINPRDGWPSEKARSASSRAHHVIDAARVFDSVQEAVADLKLVLATTARSRDIPKSVVGPDEAATESVAQGVRGIPSGYMFGRERWGLNNDEVALANKIVTLPVDPTYASLNIAQAVLVCAYEWRRVATAGALPFSLDDYDGELATQESIQRMFEHLEAGLDSRGFFRPIEKKPVTIRRLRNIFQKADLTENEVRIMRGVISCFEKYGVKDKD